MILNRAHQAAALMGICVLVTSSTSCVRQSNATGAPAPEAMLPHHAAELSDGVYEARVEAISVMRQKASTSAPSAEEAALLLEDVRHAADFRIRVRAMSLFPYLNERDEAIDVLVRCLQERDWTTNGGGNVPLYATIYLADMGATQAIPQIEDWIAFLEMDASNADAASLLKTARKDLARLKAGGGRWLRGRTG